MSEPVLIALIGAGFPTIASLAALVQARRTRQDVSDSVATSRSGDERLVALETEVAGLRRDVERVLRAFGLGTRD